MNLIEPGDSILVGVNGVFGNRLKDTAERCGESITIVEKDWGRAFELEDFRRGANGRKYKMRLMTNTPLRVSPWHYQP